MAPGYVITDFNFCIEIFLGEESCMKSNIISLCHPICIALLKNFLNKLLAHIGGSEDVSTFDFFTIDLTGWFLPYSQVRDYIHVVDLADGHIAALLKLEEADIGTIPIFQIYRYLIFYYFPGLVFGKFRGSRNVV